LLLPASGLRPAGEEAGCRARECFSAELIRSFNAARARFRFLLGRAARSSRCPDVVAKVWRRRRLQKSAGRQTWHATRATRADRRVAAPRPKHACKAAKPGLDCH